MPVILKQKYVICTIDVTCNKDLVEAVSFKTTIYRLADREIYLKHIDAIVAEVDNIVEKNLVALKHSMNLDPRQLWIKYSYSYDNSDDKADWGKDTLKVFNPLHNKADINSNDEGLIYVDFTRQKHV